MSLDHKTSERLAPKSPDSLGQDNVVQFDRVFAVQGPRFMQYITEVVTPVRQDVATMALQQLLAKVGPDDKFGELQATACVDMAFFIADQFCLRAPSKLDERLADYFALYMKRGKIDDIIKASMDAAHDFSL